MLFSGYSAVDNFIFNSINQIFNCLYSIIILKLDLVNLVHNNSILGITVHIHFLKNPI
jgi:hypothetical protein